MTFQNEEKRPILTKDDKNEFGGTRILLICCLCCTAFVVNTVSSLASPFYPSDASSFGVSEVLIGVILGMYHLTVFFVAPLTPMLIDRINVECTLKLGIAVAGCSAILFGFINQFNQTGVFIAVSVLLRIVQGCGCAFVDTSLYTIISDKFPNNLGKVSGVLTTSVGLGFMVGPPVGGFLYSAGGFFLPFVVMGVLTLLMGVFIYIALPSNRDGSKRTRLFSLYAYVEHDGLEQSIVAGYTDSGEGNHWATLAKDIPFVPTMQLSDSVSLRRILSDGKLLIILLTTIVGSSILGYQEPTLGLFLENCQYGPAAIGGLFLLRDFLFAIGSIIVGYLVDAIGPYFILACGLFLGTIGYLALGPIPPFEPSQASVIMGLVITGFAGSIPWVTGLPCLLKATRHLGNRGSLNSQLSGLQNSCLYFGIFLGSILGGVFLEVLSYRMTYLAYAALPAVTAIIFTCAMVFKRSRGNASFEESWKA